jgi:hypothetical protein
VNGGEQAFSEFIYPQASSDQVSLFSDAGTSTISDLSVTQLYSSVYTGDQVRLTVPGAPTDVAGSSTAAGSADVTWAAPADTGNTELTGFTVTAHRADDAAPKAAPAGCSTDGTSASCTVTGLEPGARYTFSVVARNKVGDGPASELSALVTIAEADDGTPSTTPPSTPPAETPATGPDDPASASGTGSGLAATGLAVALPLVAGVLALGGGLLLALRRRRHAR